MVQTCTAWVLALFGVLVCLISSQEIVDFTYSHYLQKSSSSSADFRKIAIHPHPSTLEKYEFPQACYIGQKLNQSSVDSISQKQDTDLDTYLSTLKGDFIDLLKISQKIKNAKKNVKQLGSLSSTTKRKASVTPQDISLLQKKETRLKQINDQIENYTIALQEYMYQVMGGSENNQFSETTINFEIESLRIKLEYLRGLLRDSRDSRKSQSTDFKSYFNELRERFENEGDLIKNLTSLLQNYNERAQVKAKVENLKSQIQAHELLIADKQICAQDIKQIRRKQKDNQQIKQLMINLRAKKKEHQGIPNKYCQGVAKKLQDQVKKLLKVYNYTFNCAQGKDELINLKAKQERQLADAQRRLAQLDAGKGLDDYKRRFEANREFMKGKLKEVQSFKLEKYQHNPDEIRKLIDKTQQALTQAETRKEELSGKASKETFNYRKTEEMVNAIKRLKGNYCRQYEMYEEKANQCWVKVIEYEEEVKYSTKMHNLYSEEINKLRNLESEFENLRMKILNRMN